MPSETPQPKGAARPTLAASLGVKGSLHIRSYGNVKHAHIVLRKVDEEQYTDTRGITRTRAIFSLFAHKLINVKAGKELFLYLQSPKGDLTEQSIAFEGDLLREGEEEQDDIQEIPPLKRPVEVPQAVPQKFVTPPEHERVLPPRFEKFWSKDPPSYLRQYKNVFNQSFSPLHRVNYMDMASSSSTVPSIELPALDHILSTATAGSSSSSGELEAIPSISATARGKMPSTSSVATKAAPSLPSIQTQTTQFTSSSEAQAKPSALIQTTRSMHSVHVQVPAASDVGIATSGSQVGEGSIQKGSWIGTQVDASRMQNGISANPSGPDSIGTVTSHPPTRPSRASTIVPSMPVASSSQVTMERLPDVTSSQPSELADSTRNYSNSTTRLAPNQQKQQVTPVAVAQTPSGGNQYLARIKEERRSPVLNPQFTLTPPAAAATKSLSTRSGDDDSGYMSVTNVQADDPIYVEDMSLSSLSPEPPTKPPISFAVKQEMIDISLSPRTESPTIPGLNGSKHLISPATIKPATTNILPPSLPLKPVDSFTMAPGDSRKRRMEDLDTHEIFADRFNARHIPPPTTGIRKQVSKSYMAQIPISGPPGINGISFNSNGSYFAVICRDNTIRIWSNKIRMEIAKLQHNASVVSMGWMDGDTGVVSLGSNGIINKWTKLSHNQWHWAKILDTGDADPVCLAYRHDRIAVAFPRKGVKVWFYTRGNWIQTRIITRPNVASIRFVNNGATLVGGTADGVLWVCDLPDGTMNACTFFKTKIFHIEIDVTESYVLVSQAGGRAHLASLGRNERRGKIMQVYATREAATHNTNHPFGALFTPNNNQVIFGAVGSRVLIWNRKEGTVEYELDHGNDIMIQGIALFRDEVAEDSLISVNRNGRLTWWVPPKNWDQGVVGDDLSNKRRKVV